jgi:hypothetical protein
VDDLLVNATLRPLYPCEGDAVPIAQEAGWVLGPVWTGAEKLKTMLLIFVKILFYVAVRKICENAGLVGVTRKSWFFADTH